MAGILEVLRAAAGPAAAARTGYIRGDQQRHDRERAEGEHARQIQRQERLDQQERERYDAGTKRQAGIDEQNRLLNETRRALEASQMKENEARAGYYKKGGAAGYRGTGAKGELTPKDRAQFIRTMVAPKLNPDSGELEPGMSPEEAVRIFEQYVVKDPTATAAAAPTGFAGARLAGAMGAPNPTPQATRPDTATKTTGPIGATRAALPAPGAAPPAAGIDSAALVKKYPFLFNK